MDLHWWSMPSFNSMKQYSLFAVLSLSMIVFAMAFIKKDNEQPGKHLEIMLRNIGHQVLLHSNDSTSRVLPIKQIDDNTYQISFENGFGFMPDTLMSIVYQQLAKTDGLGDYTVSVNECEQKQTIFAYEVNKATGDLKPCRGREQKKGCYEIEISFLTKKSFPYGWLLLAIIPVAFGAIYFAHKRNRMPGAWKAIDEKNGESLSNEIETVPGIADYKKLGAFLFFETKGILRFQGETIELSSKEAKALSIFASNQNEVVGRDQLMKEIWEEDGVIVITRNVDVLISKLRKRLSADPSIRIVNVHGKGYKMIV